MSRIKRTLPLILIWLWLLVSFLSMSDPDSFQRAGSFGVFVALLAILLDDLWHESQIRALAADYSARKEKTLSVFRMACLDADRLSLRIISTLLEREYVGDRREQQSLKIFDDRSNEEWAVEVTKNLEKIEKSLAKVTEVEESVGSKEFDFLGRSSLLEQRARFAKQKLELFSIGIATLQWGYGDLLLCFVNPELSQCTS